MVKIAIVEDEDHFAEKLKSFLIRYEKEYGRRFDIVRFTDGDEITEKYSGDYDIILMDIQMQFMDGMTAAEKIREWDREVVIIFITNMENFAIRGYQVDALDYVLKPISYPSFSVKLKRALERVRNREEHVILIQIPSGRLKLLTEHIHYVECEGHNLLYHTVDGTYQTRQRIADAENELKDYGFFRINKGCLVNLRYVDGGQGGSCLIRGEELPISRARRNDFMAAMAEFIGKF